jgi:hypothetical protein
MPDPATDTTGRHINGNLGEQTTAATAESITREIDLRTASARTERAIDASYKLDGVLAKGIAEGKRVSKLAEAVAAIKDKKLAHDAKGQEWMDRLAKITEREVEAYAIGDAVVNEREADLREMEATMRELGNLPNVGSGK